MVQLLTIALIVALVGVPYGDYLQASKPDFL